MFWPNTCQLWTIRELFLLYTFSAELLEVHRSVDFKKTEYVKITVMLTISGEIRSRFDVSKDAEYLGEENSISLSENGADMCNHSAGASWLSIRILVVLQGQLQP